MESAKARCEGGGPGNAGCRPEQVACTGQRRVRGWCEGCAVEGASGMGPSQSWLRVGSGRAGQVEGVVLVGPGSRSGRAGPGLTESGGGLGERKSARSYG
jgi:hypothetical protein